MRASPGNLPPLRKLQPEQAATTLFQVVCPPRERGMRWSKVNSLVSPQYWHWKRSRRKTLNRVKAGWRAGLTWVFSDTTEGSFIVNEGLRTATSYSETMFT